MVIQMPCVQPNCQSAIHTQTQMQTETEGYRMHVTHLQGGRLHYYG